MDYMDGKIYDGRIQWLDAMRGFTMLMVVAYHTELLAFQETEKTSAAMTLLVLFRMPLFFFVSGFLAYSSRFAATLGDVAALVWKKVRIQVLPTLVFLCAYIVIRKTGFANCFMQAMRSPMKWGYWFTWVLLQMFLIYYAFAFVEQRLGWKRKSWGWMPVVAFWVLSLVAYETAYMPRWFSYPKSQFMATTSIIQTIRYMHFFLFGNIVRRHWDTAQRVFSHPLFFPLLAATAFICCSDFLRWHTLRFMWTNLPRTLGMYSTMLIVVMFFRHYASSFTSDKPVGAMLQYIGKRTLDVYLLHYIFMPKMPFVGQWLNANRPNFVLSITLSLIVALVVTAFCLLASNVLRISPIFSEYLFGRKQGGKSVNQAKT